MNTLPFAQIGMWGFSLVSLFTLCLGGLGVLDQGADFTWRDSDVLVRFFLGFFFLSFSFWDSVSRTNMCLLHSVWEGPLHCRKVEKRSRTLFCRCMQSAWYVKNGIQHTHTHTLVQSINFLHNMAVQLQGHVAGPLQANVMSLALLIICPTQWEQQTIMHQTNPTKIYNPHDERSVKDTTANCQSPIRLNIIQIPLKPQPHLPPLT